MLGFLDRLSCSLAFGAELAGPTLVVMVCTGLFAGGLLGAAVVRWLARVLKLAGASPMPGLFGAALISLVVYLVALAADPLLHSVLEPPADVPPSLWDQIGFFEWKLLGEWALPILPLSQHPAAGIVLHLALWGGLTVLIRAVLLWVYRHHPLKWDTREDALPFYYRWVGSTTARRADDRFKAWSSRLLWVLVPVHAMAGLLVATAASQRGPSLPRCVDVGTLEAASANLPGLEEMLAMLTQRADEPLLGAIAPGAWVLTGLLSLLCSVHLLVEGRRPSETETTEEKDEELEALMTPPPDPLRRLGDALQARFPGAFLEALEEHPERPAEEADFAEGTSPLLREGFEALAGVTTLWSHQREVLDHLDAVWRMASPEALGAAPTLREELGPTPIHREQMSTPHALVIAPEGAGRSTLTRLAALHVHLDRGASTLALLPDREAAEAWAERLRESLTRSSVRWNLEVCVAGIDLADSLVAGRAPAVIVADLESLENEVLATERVDAFFGRLGLLVADDLDRFTGVAEMHLHLVMRRVWALLDAVHDAPYPPVVLAALGPSGEGMERWARHVLSAPMRVFDGDGAPRVTRALLRRRDLADAHGEAIPLTALAEACDAASIPWHLRRAGDEGRARRRAETELGQLRRHHVMDPLDAEVVLLEGTYPDVRREAARLAHAGRRADRGSVVLVLAPPADEEMVLHEEARDAQHRPRIEALPHATTLAEPHIVRQRHLDRALGREQAVDALEQRFGKDLVDSVLQRLKERGRVQSREVFAFDAAKDDVISRRLVRAAGETALGEPIRAGCVSDSKHRVEVFDRATGAPLIYVDAAIASALYPPGAVFEHASGRYQALASPAGDRIAAEQLDQPLRSTADRSLEVEAADIRWEDRRLGGATLRVSRFDGEVLERVHGVRRYAPGPRLEEHRRYDTPLSARYRTELLAIALESEGEALDEAAAVPLTAALRMMLPCALRGAADLVDVGLTEVDGAFAAVFFDRTPGSSGFARAIAEGRLADLLQLARLVLERLVGPELERLRAIHDTASIEGDAPRGPDAWRITDALAWLDGLLDPPPEEASALDAPELRRGRRVAFVRGEGVGDLGRLWVSSTGRTDDLVWTRHRWRSSVELEGHPAGPVFMDMAVERRTIARAIRRAATAGASREAAARPSDGQAWMRQHHAALATASLDLAALYERLRKLAGPEHHVDTVLAFVAGIPTSPAPIPPAERAPLAVLARRKADLDAKVLLAWALLPQSAKATVRLADDGPVLEVEVDGSPRVVDLSGQSIRHVEGDTGAVLALDWGELTPPEEVEDEEA